MAWLLWWFAVWINEWFARRFQIRRHGRRRGLAQITSRAQAKPVWVVREIVRLKALMPDAGCRSITHIFNRRFAISRRMTVGKSFVADTLRKHQHEIKIVRRKIKHRVPRPAPRNFLAWGLDLTGKTDEAGDLHMIFGLLDHGSRALLSLVALPNKCSWTLLGYLFLAIGKYGKPRALRTDNEACFTSRLFRTALFLFGIRHQRSDPGCPWQNGRIERLFGTLKGKLDWLEVVSFDALGAALEEFRLWYNHVRPHQHLGGATPAEAWAGVNPFAAKIKGEFWFEAWDSLLQGYYLRR